VGALPLFPADGRSDLCASPPPLAEAKTDLRLLTHPEARRLRRVPLALAHPATQIRLPWRTSTDNGRVPVAPTVAPMTRLAGKP